MPENWKSYYANVNGKLSSIALDLALGDAAPTADKPWLLWVWFYLQSPRPDGLSDRSEFPTICAIEDELAKQLATHCQAIYAGRITGENRRELYFYGADKKNFKRAVKHAMSQFPTYRYDFDDQHEPDWNQYLNVLYPSDEDLQRIANRDVLDALEEQGDNLKALRDVHHCIYFKTTNDRDWYASKARQLGYSIEQEIEVDSKAAEGYPFRLVIT